MTRKTRYGTNVGQRVTEMIARGQTTQAALADRLGVSRPHLNQMLTGRCRAHPDLEEKARRALLGK